LVVQRCPDFPILTFMVANLFSHPCSKLKYMDEEGDKITISSQLELTEAVRIASNNSVGEKITLELYLDREPEDPTAHPEVQIPVPDAPDCPVPVTSAQPDVFEVPKPVTDSLENDWVLSEPFSASQILSTLSDPPSPCLVLPSNAAERDLRTLLEMGFTNTKLNLTLLLRHKGNISAVVEQLLAS